MTIVLGLLAFVFWLIGAITFWQEWKDYSHFHDIENTKGENAIVVLNCVIWFVWAIVRVF